MKTTFRSIIRFGAYLTLALGISAVLASCVGGAGAGSNLSALTPSYSREVVYAPPDTGSATLFVPISGDAPASYAAVNGFGKDVCGGGCAAIEIPHTLIQPVTVSITDLQGAMLLPLMVHFNTASTATVDIFNNPITLNLPPPPPTTATTAPSVITYETAISAMLNPVRPVQASGTVAAGLMPVLTITSTLTDIQTIESTTTSTISVTASAREGITKSVDITVSGSVITQSIATATVVTNTLSGGTITTRITTSITSTVQRGSEPPGASVVADTETTVTHHLLSRIFVNDVTRVTVDASGNPIGTSADNLAVEVLSEEGEWVAAAGALRARLLAVMLPGVTLSLTAPTILTLDSHVLLTTTTEISMVHLTATVTSYLTVQTLTTTITTTLTNPIPVNTTITMEYTHNTSTVENAVLETLNITTTLFHLTAVRNTTVELTSTAALPNRITQTMSMRGTVFVNTLGVPVSAMLPPPGTAYDTEGFTVGAEWTNNIMFEAIRAQYPWSRGYFGQGVTIGVVGRGFRTAHQDLSANVVAGTNFASNNNNIDAAGDPVRAGQARIGTGVAGIIAGARNDADIQGVASSAKLMPLQIANGLTTVDMIEAFRYAVANSVRLIHNSHQSPRSVPFSGGLSGLLLTPEGVDYGAVNVPEYITYFRGMASVFAGADAAVVFPAGDQGWNAESGTVVVAGATMAATAAVQEGTLANFADKGNVALSVIAPTANQTDLMGLLPLYEGTLLGKWLVAVATNEDSSIASFSNACGRAMYWCLAVLGAGSRNFTSDSDSNSDYGPLSSTHAAAAGVSGGIALLQSRFPAMPMQALVAILLTTADDLGETGVDPIYGHGRLNLERAIAVQGNVSLHIAGAAQAAGSLSSTITVSVTTMTVTRPTDRPPSVLLSVGFVVSAFNLPVPAAVQSPLPYNTIQYGDNPGVSLMQASVAYARGYFGQSVTVAYIGNGANPANPRISANLLSGVSVGVGAGGAIVTGTATANPATDGDTTGVAGLVVGVGAALTATARWIPVGAAPQAKLIPLKIHDGTSPVRNAVTAALSIAMARDAHVVLMPWRMFHIPSASTRVYDISSNEEARLGSDIPVMGDLLLQGYVDGAHTPEYYQRFIANMGDAMRGKDAIAVVPAGDGRWNTVNGRHQLERAGAIVSDDAADFPRSNQIIGSDNKRYSITRANQPGILAEAPLFSSDLLGKWMVVVEANQSGTIEPYSNGCGTAMRWCLAVRRFNVIVTNTKGDDNLWNRQGTSYSAAHVAGALAVLRSRFPTMPMQAVAAILLRTADDAGANGVDAVYGHGLLNLGAAIAAQGDINLVIGLNDVVVQTLFTITTSTAMTMTTGSSMTMTMPTSTATAAYTREVVYTPLNTGNATLFVPISGTAPASYAAVNGFGKGACGGGCAAIVIPNSLIQPATVSVTDVQGVMLLSLMVHFAAGTGATVDVFNNPITLNLPTLPPPAGGGIAYEAAISVMLNPVQVGATVSTGLTPALTVFTSTMTIAQTMANTVTTTTTLTNATTMTIDAVGMATVSMTVHTMTTETTVTNVTTTNTVTNTITNTIDLSITTTVREDFTVSESENREITITHSIATATVVTGTISGGTITMEVTSSITSTVRQGSEPPGASVVADTEVTITQHLVSRIFVTDVTEVTVDASGNPIGTSTDKLAVEVLGEKGEWVAATGALRARLLAVMLPRVTLSLTGPAVLTLGSHVLLTTATELSVTNRVFTVTSTMTMDVVKATTTITNSTVTGTLTVQTLTTTNTITMTNTAMETETSLTTELETLTMTVATMTNSVAVATLTTTMTIGTTTLTTEYTHNTVALVSVTVETVDVTQTLYHLTTHTTTTVELTTTPPSVTNDRITQTMSRRATLFVNTVGVPLSAVLPRSGSPISINYNTAEWQRNDGLEAIGAQHAYARGYFGQGVTVGVIGGGLQTDHVDLTANLVAGWSFAANNAAVNGTDWLHQQAVGIIAAERGNAGGVAHGVAPQAKIMPVQAQSCPNGGNGARVTAEEIACSDERFMESFAYAVENNVPIVQNVFRTVRSRPLRSAWVSFSRFDAQNNDLTGGVRSRANPQLLLTPEMLAPLGNGGILDEADYLRFFRRFSSIFHGADIAAVFPAGDDGWNERPDSYLPIELTHATPLAMMIHNAAFIAPNQGSYDLRGIFPDVDADEHPRLRQIYQPTESGGGNADRANQTDIMGLLPLYDSRLLGKWVVAVGVDHERKINTTSNACARARYWCIAAPGGGNRVAEAAGLASPVKALYNPTDWVQAIIPSGQTGIANAQGTHIAAAHVSGALAVLRSRFPAMPMDAIIAIMFKTAVDLGDTGVDSVFGHGYLNLSAAIAVQGSMNLVIDNAATEAGKHSGALNSLGTYYPGQGFFSRNQYGVLISGHIDPPRGQVGFTNTVDYNNSRTALEGINALPAYQHGYLGRGITIALAGAGFNTAHADLAPNVVGGTNFAAANQQYDADSRGTDMAALAAAAIGGGALQGVAPSAKLVPLQIANATNTVGIAPALRYAVSNNIRIISPVYQSAQSALSQPQGDVRFSRDGSTHVFSNFLVTPDLLDIGIATLTSYTGHFDALGDSVANADIAVVWQAGDQGWNSDTGMVFPYRGNSGLSLAATQAVADITLVDYGAPVLSSLYTTANQTDIMGLAPLYDARLAGKWMVAVATQRNANTIASFSNACGRAMYWCLAARGDGLAGIGGGSVRGTHAAAAQVAGALAVLASRLPSMPIEVAMAILFDSADDAGATGVDEVYGHGILNLGAAISMQGSINLAIVQEPLVTLAGSLDKPASDAGVFVPGIGYVITNAAGSTVSAVLVSPQPLIYPDEFTTGAEWTNNRMLEAIRVHFPWHRGYFGQGVTIGMVGRGFRTTHQDLAPNVVAGTNFAANNTSIDATADPVRAGQARIGTGAAGIIAGARNGADIQGVAVSAKLMPLQIANATATVDMLEAFRYAVANSVHIIHNAHQSPRSVPFSNVMAAHSTVTAALSELILTPELVNYGAANGIEYFNLFRGLARTFAGADVAVVWAAGDQGWNARNGRVSFNNQVMTAADAVQNLALQSFAGKGNVALSVVVPSASQTDIMGLAPLYESALAGKWLVAMATDQRNNPATFSNACGRAMYWCLAVRGRDTLLYTSDSDADDDYGLLNSTHASAAAASGALALMKSRFPAMPMEALIAILLKTAVDLGDRGVDPIYGQGFLNLQGAIGAQGAQDLVIAGTATLVGTYTVSSFPAGFNPGYGVLLTNQFGLTGALLIIGNAPGTTDYNTEEYRNSGGLSRINAVAAYNRDYFGQGVTVGMVGHGFRTAHPGLASNVVAGSNFIDNSGNIQQSSPGGTGGVGTGAAGFIAAVLDGQHMHGVAPRAKLLPLQIANGSTTLNPTVAYRHAAQMNVPIIHNLVAPPSLTVNLRWNLSYRNSAGTALNTMVTLPVSPEMLDLGMFEYAPYRNFFSQSEEALRGADVAVVLPGGSNGWNSASGGPFAAIQSGGGALSSPAVVHNGVTAALSVLYATTTRINQAEILGLGPLYEDSLLGKWVVAVGTGQDANNTIDNLSNGCGRAMFWCVAAPGGAGLSTTIDNGGYGGIASSPSQVAAAHVSGALAVLRSRYPGMPMNAVLAILFRTATDLGAPGVDAVYGHGLINLHKAITLRSDVNLYIAGDLVAGGLDRPDAPSGTAAVFLSETGWVITSSAGAAVSAVRLLDPRGTITTRNYGGSAEFTNNRVLGKIGVPTAHERGYWGAGVTVGLIGAGFRTTHQDLAFNTLPGLARNFITGQNGAVGISQNDDMGSGVAGFIAGRDNDADIIGVASRAKLVPLQIVGANGLTAAITSALQYAADNTIQIVQITRPDGTFNNPLTSVNITTSGASASAYMDDLIITPELLTLNVVNSLSYQRHFDNMADILRGSDMLAVWATENNGWHEHGSLESGNFTVAATAYAQITVADDALGLTVALGTLYNTANQTDIIGLAPLYNADLLGKWVVVVATQGDGGNVTPYANACGRAMHWCISAPGRDEFSYTPGGSADNNYWLFQGSQPAAAHVSGALAVIRSRFPNLPMSAAAAILFATATDLGDTGVDEVYGHGHLNLAAAVTAVSGINLVITAGAAGSGTAAGGLSITIPGVNQPGIGYVVTNAAGEAVSAVLLDAPLAVTTTFNYNPADGNAEYRQIEGLLAIRVSVAHSRGYFGQGATIGMVGRGFRTTHQDLEPNTVPGTNFVDNNNIISTNDRDGVAVAGIVAGQQDGLGVVGVAPEANLMPLQIQNGNRMAELSVVLAHAAAQNLPIVQHVFRHSLTHPLLSVNITTSGASASAYMDDLIVTPELISMDVVNSTVYRRQFRALKDVFDGEDMVAVWPAGNDGWNSRGSFVSPAITIAASSYAQITIADDNLSLTVGLGDLYSTENQTDIMGLAPLYEADLLGKWVVAVAMPFDQSDITANEISSFSNACGRAMHWCLSAPGQHRWRIWTPFPASDTDYGNYGHPGTSHAAAAHVSGALAVMRSRFPTMPMSSVLAILFQTAIDLGEEGVDEIYGHGMLNLGAAITVQQGIRLVVTSDLAGSLADSGAGGTGAPALGAAAGKSAVNAAEAVEATEAAEVTEAAAEAAEATVAAAESDASTAPRKAGSGLALAGLKRTYMARGFSTMAQRLSNLSMAVSYLDGQFYYDAPLSSLTEFETAEEEYSFGNAAADMFGASQSVQSPWGFAAVSDVRSGQIRRAGVVGDAWRVEYDICEDCDPSSWRTGATGGERIGSAYLGEGQQGVGAAWSPKLPKALSAFSETSEVELFSALGLGEDGREETYRQYGVRWRESLSSLASRWSRLSQLSLLAELSEIREDGSLLGTHGKVFGLTDTTSRQLRLELSGEWSGWSWQGGMTQGWVESGVDGSGILKELSDMTYSQWHVDGMARSLLRGGDELRFGVTGMPRVRGDVKVEYYRASNAVVDPSLYLRLPTGVRSETLTMNELGDSIVVWRAGYKWRPLPLQSMETALGVEAVSGGASDGEYAASFQLRWGF